MALERVVLLRCRNGLRSLDLAPLQIKRPQSPGQRRCPRAKRLDASFSDHHRVFGPVLAQGGSEESQKILLRCRLFRFGGQRPVSFGEPRLEHGGDVFADSSTVVTGASGIKLRPFRPNFYPVVIPGGAVDFSEESLRLDLSELKHSTEPEFVSPSFEGRLVGDVGLNVRDRHKVIGGKIATGVTNTRLADVPHSNVASAARTIWPVPGHPALLGPDATDQ